MITRPLNDIRCLMLILAVVLERIADSAIQEFARQYKTRHEFADELRTRPQLNDRLHVLPNAPRVACSPPQRLRWNANDPNCVERAADFLTVAEVLDPDTPRTLATLRIRGQLHTFPVEHTPDGPVPVILDPLDSTNDVEDRRVPVNLSYGAVARLLGYGPGQPSPMSAPLAWAQQLAVREGVEPRNGADLLSVVERYANVYPGGRQGLAELARQVWRPVASAGRKVVKEGGKAAKVVAEEGAEEYRKNPKIGQLLRAAVVGYGGPFAVLAIDVVENRLKKRGYSLGSMAESHDADVFAFE